MTNELKLLAITAQGYEVHVSTQPLWPFVAEIRFSAEGRKIGTLRGFGKTLGSALDELKDALDAWRDRATHCIPEESIYDSENDTRPLDSADTIPPEAVA